MNDRNSFSVVNMVICIKTTTMHHYINFGLVVRVSLNIHILLTDSDLYIEIYL
jgi:hypothetical protein